MIFIDRFKEADRLSIAVIGDFMLDRYLWGTANRISPESPTSPAKQNPFVTGISSFEDKMAATTARSIPMYQCRPT